MVANSMLKIRIHFITYFIPSDKQKVEVPNIKQYDASDKMKEILQDCLFYHKLLPNLLVNLFLRQETSFGIEAIHPFEIGTCIEELDVFLVNIFLQGDGLLVDVFLTVQIVTVIAGAGFG